MIPDINDVRSKTFSNEKLNECKRITETQNKIDELARKCKQRAEEGYGYLSEEFPNISIDYIYDIKKVFEDAGFVFNEQIEHWWTMPDQVRGIYIEWKKDDFYKKLGM